MSAPFSPAARTRTSTSPVPGTGSGCSSITISPSRMVAARIARKPTRRRRAAPSTALEQRDALDVVSLREHVDRADLAQRPPGLDQFGGVGRERGGVAGDVDDPLWGGVDDAVDHLLREARAGRVDDDDIGAPGALEQLGQRQAGVAGEEVGLRDLVAPRARDRVGDGLLDQLDPPQLARARSERERDRADPANTGRTRAPSPRAPRTPPTTSYSSSAISVFV